MEVVCMVAAQGTQLPAAVVLGDASCSGTMSGSFTQPITAATWSAPAGQASGSVELQPTVRPETLSPRPKPVTAAK